MSAKRIGIVLVVFSSVFELSCHLLSALLTSIYCRLKSDEGTVFWHMVMFRRGSPDKIDNLRKEPEQA
jgi:hypothetical protein